ncbi:bifunctional cobalt-precorrin-7 (C(5))-methyltransferase CbiE/decarboxylating cobalt-precorrin-6B (C(15))-methyltransferase CbiT [Actinophytocola gossypii]|uniref:Precorrin-6y C5,15-methyltransferase (Decarboxylating) subunit CbiE n=1 Tax=Actinophytocola gossypii TaxID=2812003 RepID=A0ABT2JA02_9PSEU|nr:bifunctional cobalt-precorrin-7 (C(5))-methyltransferase CbiE/decarboxylating cobalt-precorrin-6B (C(15))-methyltransferase CbiT [Actinophytocola gossypii]MCT2584675.1 precorrin-6y C5,15-methyltransferase (decarboxylating) subunit CbiE [Actinophytocola gossypii]
MTATVTVIGVDGHDLPPGAGNALAAAGLVVGGRALLRRWATAALGTGAGSASVPDKPRTIELSGQNELPGTALDALAASVDADEHAVVLTAGDPGYFGVLRALRERSLPTVCWPSVTQVQRVAAMVHRPWDDITVVSAHGRAFRDAVNVCRARPAVGVLTAPGTGPAEFGAALSGWRRTLVVLEAVGGDQETLSIVDPAEAADRTWRQPSVVLCLADLDRVGRSGWIAGGEPAPPVNGWALDEAEFTHREGMASGPELRALALARLAPRPGALVWDVAAGCGALGVEAARLGAAVIAVENDPGLCVRIVANAKRHGVDVRLVDGQVPEALVGLPQPDAVFLGTARTDVVRSCAGAGASRIVVEVRELGSVGPVRDTLTDAGYAVDGRLLFAAPVDGLAQGSAAVRQASSTMLLWGIRR